MFTAFETRRHKDIFKQGNAASVRRKCQCCHSFAEGSGKYSTTKYSERCVQYHWNRLGLIVLLMIGYLMAIYISFIMITLLLLF